MTVTPLSAWKRTSRLGIVVPNLVVLAALIFAAQSADPRPIPIADAGHVAVPAWSLRGPDP